jgi:hypothetical protein
MCCRTVECILTLYATGTDGVATSARGSQTLFLDATEIGGNATVAVPNITVRQSKAIAGSTPTASAGRRSSSASERAATSSS